MGRRKKSCEREKERNSEKGGGGAEGREHAERVGCSEVENVAQIQRPVVVSGRNSLQRSAGLYTANDQLLFGCSSPKDGAERRTGKGDSPSYRTATTVRSDLRVVARSGGQVQTISVRSTGIQAPTTGCGRRGAEQRDHTQRDQTHLATPARQ